MARPVSLTPQLTSQSSSKESPQITTSGSTNAWRMLRSHVRCRLANCCLSRMSISYGSWTQPGSKSSFSPVRRALGSKAKSSSSCQSSSFSVSPTKSPKSKKMICCKDPIPILCTPLPSPSMILEWCLATFLTKISMSSSATQSNPYPQASFPKDQTHESALTCLQLFSRILACLLWKTASCTQH